MNRYLIAYLGWLAGTLVMAGIALGWYRRVEGIGLDEVASKLAGRATDATEATDAEPNETPAA